MKATPGLNVVNNMFLNHALFPYPSITCLSDKFTSTAVGKSAYLKALGGEAFDPNSHLSTAGLDFRLIHATKNEKSFPIRVWDAGGHDWWIEISKGYFPKMNGFIVMFDITYDDSFDSAESLITMIKKSKKDAKIILVGAKCDLQDERTVTRAQGIVLAIKHDLKYFEISSKTNTQIQESLASLINDLEVTA